ncbi:MAG: C40 family peptidase, partial [Allobaculum sp.]|nr:C40 family peptidase [Allobaculum sp.]
PEEMPNDPAPSTTDYSELNGRIAEEALKLVDNTNGLWCTQVVQMAMSNAGVQDALNLWPNEFADMYGYYTDNPQPGNLIYYNQGGNGLDHIAIYIGDGQAVHGNYLIDGESKTVIASAKLQGCDDYSFIQVER